MYITLGGEAAKKGTGGFVAGRNLATTEGCEAFLLLVGTLLWIQRKEGGLWIPPTGQIRELMTRDEGVKNVKKTIKPRGKETIAIPSTAAFDKAWDEAYGITEDYEIVSS